VVLLLCDCVAETDWVWLGVTLDVCDCVCEALAAHVNLMALRRDARNGSSVTQDKPLFAENRLAYAEAPPATGARFGESEETPWMLKGAEDEMSRE
jgi:hypothetical protein